MKSADVVGSPDNRDLAGGRENLELLALAVIKRDISGASVQSRGGGLYARNSEGHHGFSVPRIECPNKAVEVLFVINQGFQSQHPFSHPNVVLVDLVGGARDQAPCGSHGGFRKEEHVMTFGALDLDLRFERSGARQRHREEEEERSSQPWPGSHRILVTPTERARPVDWARVNSFPITRRNGSIGMPHPEIGPGTSRCRRSGLSVTR